MDQKNLPSVDVSGSGAKNANSDDEEDGDLARKHCRGVRVGRA